MKSERIKIVNKDGTVGSKQLCDIILEIDGHEVPLSKVFDKIIELEKTLETKERDFHAELLELNNKIEKVESILFEFIDDFQDTFGGEE